MADNDSTTGVSSAHSKMLRVPPPWIRLAHLAAWLLHMYELADAHVVRRIVLELRDRRYASLSTVSPDGKQYVLLPPALDMRGIDWDTFDIVDETGKFRFPLYVRWTVVEDIVSHRWEQTELRITADNQSQAVSISNSGHMGNINLSNAPGVTGQSTPTTTPSPAEHAPQSPPQPMEEPAIELRSATDEACRAALRKVYQTAEYPPNLNKVVAPVQNLLKSSRLKAGKVKIQNIAGEEEFRRLRSTPGIKRRSFSSPAKQQKKP